MEYVTIRATKTTNARDFLTFKICYIQIPLKTWFSFLASSALARKKKSTCLGIFLIKLSVTWQCQKSDTLPYGDKEKKKGKNTSPRGEWKTSIYVPLSTRSMMEWHKMSLPATKTCAQLICNLFLGNCFEGLQEDGSINQDCNDLSVDTDIFNWCNISFILI